MEHLFADTIVDDLTTVPEQFRSLYTEDPVDKKFKINPSFASVAGAIDGLNGALRNERKATSALRGQKDIGVILKETFGLATVEEVKAKLEELNLVVAEKSKVDPAKLRAEIAKTFEGKEEGHRVQMAKMQGTLDKHLIDSASATALAENKGNLKLLLPIIKQSAVVVADGDDFVVRIRDAAGDYRGNGAGGFMTVQDLVKELKASSDYGVAFQSEAPSGGGKLAGRTTQPPTQHKFTTGPGVAATPAELIANGLQARRNRR